MNDLGNVIVSQAKVTLIFTGYGFLTVTDKAIFWNKSATSYLAFGLSATQTENHLFLPLNCIVKVDKYTYFPGGGMVITTNEGHIYKIAFKKKKDFINTFDYLKSVIK